MKFHKIYIEITDICKLSCSFCTPKKARRGVMPLPLFKDIIKQIADYTKFISLHVLGDPLCIENLDEYIYIGSHYNIKFDIVTSGAFLQKKHFSILTQDSIHQVSFSLDALFNNKNLNKNIKQYLDAIIELYIYANMHAPKLYINLRLFGKYDYTYLLQRFQNATIQAEKRRIRLAKNFFIRFHKPFMWHNKNKTHDLQFSLDSINYQLQNNTKSHNNEFLDSTSLKTQNNFKQNKPYCFGSVKQLAILANGIVVPCCIDTDGSMPLGNLCVQDFASILKSNQMQAMQKAQYTHKNLPYLCRTCTFRGV